MNKYTFNFFTGTWYCGELWSHTVEVYPIAVKAETFEEAAKKMKKGLPSKARYNKCFNENTIIQVYDSNNRSGLYWIKDDIIKWEGETCYHTPQLYGAYEMRGFELPTPEYRYRDTSFIARFCNSRITYSYVGWLRMCMRDLDYSRGCSIQQMENRKAIYKRNVIDAIEGYLKSDFCPDEDKAELAKLETLC